MEDLKDCIWKKGKFQRTGKHHQSVFQCYILQIRKQIGLVVMVCYQLVTEQKSEFNLKNWTEFRFNTGSESGLEVVIKTILECFLLVNQVEMCKHVSKIHIFTQKDTCLVQSLETKATRRKVSGVFPSSVKILTYSMLPGPKKT